MQRKNGRMIAQATHSDGKRVKSNVAAGFKARSLKNLSFCILSLMFHIDDAVIGHLSSDHLTHADTT